MSDPYETWIARAAGKQAWWSLGDHGDVTGCRDALGNTPLSDVTGTPVKGAKPIRRRQPGTTRTGAMALQSTDQSSYVRNASFNTGVNPVMLVTIRVDATPSANRNGWGVDDGSLNRFTMRVFNSPARALNYVVRSASNQVTATVLSSAVAGRAYHVFISTDDTANTIAVGIGGEVLSSSGLGSGVDETGQVFALGAGGTGWTGAIEHMVVVNDARCSRANTTNDKNRNIHKVWLKRHRRGDRSVA